MKAYFINVGHGNMSLVKTDNKSILIDCNITNDNDALKQINEVFDNKIIDIFIITHLHKDHMQGINALIDDGFEIKNVYESGFRYSADNDCAKEDLYKEVVKFLDDYNAEVPEPSTNAFVKDGDLNLYCLNSFRNTDIEDENIAIHYNCLVIKIEESNNSILYCGDTNREIWEDEIADEFKHLLETNILLASHHGSRTFFFNNGKNSDDEDAFEEHIENIIPEYTIISAKNNDEKKEGWPPHEEAINLYKKYTKESVEITGEKDTLIFELNDNGVVQGKHLRNSSINESIAGLYRKESILKTSAPGLIGNGKRFA